MTHLGKAEPGCPTLDTDAWIANIIMIILAGFFVCVRLMGRYIRGGFKMDDYVVIAALISSIILSVTHAMAIHHGFGRQIVEVTHEERTIALKWMYAGQLFYNLTISLAKMSILFLYMRVFYIERYIRLACISLNIFLGANAFAFILAAIWHCDPVASFWDKSIPNARCLPANPLWMTFAAVNISTDIVLLVLPVQAVLRFNLRPREKFGLVLVFSLGAFVCITSIFRTVALAKATSTLPEDVTWGSIPAILASLVECNTGIICACLPVIRQPLSIIFPCLASDSSRDRYKADRPPFPSQRVNANGLRRATHTAHATSLMSICSDINMTDDFQNKMPSLPSSAGNEEASTNDSEARIIRDDIPQNRNDKVPEAAGTGPRNDV
ncbi:hypothetical protein GX51_00506 [Blastomyces parvus]|uniref:Rhodopsin domain-containing protein n=1 Tax=Blastomyces parvus TaxID=2060905 RepID=A0A2B7XLJ6_9EURO|nr:hypothetical protein GX51_00506 [Blastomyces parvus]